MRRIVLPIPENLLRLLDGCVPPGQARTEWIREAIRQRILREGPHQEEAPPPAY